MTHTLRLPTAEGRTEPYTPRPEPAYTVPEGPPRCRVAYAAAHVVSDPYADNTPGAPAVLDWDRTLAFRHELWRWGFGVAEAMDTAQRGMGLDWPTAAELVRRSAAEARSVGGRLVAGVCSDHLTSPEPGLAEVTAAYLEQLAVVEEAGAVPVIMASRALARAATGPDDYLTVYAKVLDQVSGPAVLHWLGEMFDPQLRGYWGSTDLDAASGTVLTLLRAHAERIDGIKVSLLDAERERWLRAQLPAGVRLYTGDDFHYSELVLGDADGHSDALLGVLAAIAPPASQALRALDAGDVPGYRAAMEPTVPLGRLLFTAPTQHYKTGIVFLAWLNGHQPHFGMVNGAQSARSLTHLAELFRRADHAGALLHPELAVRRMRALLEVHGLTN
ncbi:dihydrodipicolinate synthase family protein [Streptomyces sp. AJS327]|uniref:dihydrodipicolinate synthase family protein n=1 Tax=Streptomyces sp. AJS327 TaxID=2545265 RepID=UPI0015DE7B72|nr:dihydrodipicolinate synthase family protein [Streptomyces sp. AJS327]MBA0050138.1 dihydrodipicolinate synthase family protein [Streptomyces sp. AJS327]